MRKCCYWSMNKQGPAFIDKDAAATGFSRRTVEQIRDVV